MDHSGPRRLLVSVLLILLIALGASLTPRALAQAAPAEISSHVRGSVLPGSTVTFQWTSAAGADEYFFYAGTTQGGNELFGASQGLRLSVTVGGLPTDGSPVFVRIWTRTGADWAFSDSFFATVGGATEVPAEITSPTFATTLPGDSVTFEWSAGSGVDQYFLYVGTTQGGNELFGASQGLSRSVTVPGLPTDGSIVWVRIWSLFGGAWQFRDAAYMAAAAQASGLQPDLANVGFTPLGTAFWTSVTGANRSAVVDQVVAAAWIPTVVDGSFSRADSILRLVAAGDVSQSELSSFKTAIETLASSASEAHVFLWGLPDGSTIATIGLTAAGGQAVFEPISSQLGRLQAPSRLRSASMPLRTTQAAQPDLCLTTQVDFDAWFGLTGWDANKQICIFYTEPFDGTISHQFESISFSSGPLYEVAATKQIRHFLRGDYECKEVTTTFYWTSGFKRIRVSGVASGFAGSVDIEGSFGSKGQDQEIDILCTDDSASQDGVNVP